MKSTPYCPSCKNPIKRSEVNLEDWVARCEECGAELSLAELDYHAESDDRHAEGSIPRGVTLKPGFDSMEIRFSLFSLRKLLFGTFAALFWNGIVSVFLSLAVAAVCYNSMGYVPEWIPVPGLEDGEPVMNDQVMGWRMTIFFCLFLVPFVAVGAYLILYLLLRLAGHTRVVLEPRLCQVATGFGFLAWRRSFQPSDILSVKRTIAYSQQRTDDDNFRIELETNGKAVKFGSLLSQDQQLWLIAVLRRALTRGEMNDFSRIVTPTRH